MGEWLGKHVVESRRTIPGGPAHLFLIHVGTEYRADLMDSNRRCPGYCNERRGYRGSAVYSKLAY